jgi:hypothetical protein
VAAKSKMSYGSGLRGLLQALVRRCSERNEAHHWRASANAVKRRDSTYVCLKPRLLGHSVTCGVLAR